MKKFNICIEEVISQDFEVEAETVEEAMEKASKNYKNGEFILDNPSVTFKSMNVMDEAGNSTDWVEF